MFEANLARRTRLLTIGAEKSPILCIDDFSAAPQLLVDHAVRAHYIDVGPLYPGVRAPVSHDYVDALLRAVAPDMEQAFGSPPERQTELCAYSMVTASPTGLKGPQRIPHFDGPEPNRYAFLHYLCGPHFGGTSFYRHRSTGFESITAERLELYREMLGRELKASPPPPNYINGDTTVFEQLHSVAAGFNRLIVYRGNLLHSGDIPAGLVLVEDPRVARLTINGFGFLA